MEIVTGLFIISAGAFCQSSSYVPINRIKKWSWESYWIVQGVFAWIILPLLGALSSVPENESLLNLFLSNPKATVLTVIFGMLWGIGGLTFGLSMRYLGVALGQSIAIGICAALGTLFGPVVLNWFYPGQGLLSSITWPVIIGVITTLFGIIVIGRAGIMKSSSMSEEDIKKAISDYNYTKGLAVAILCGLMSACFNIGLAFGSELRFPASCDMLASLPATFLVTLGGFIINAVYCFILNSRNKTWKDYRTQGVLGNNLLFCLIAGALWYSQFFGLSLGKGFLSSSPALQTFSWCILMALNITFSNIWGIILKEWKGCSRKTVLTLVTGIIILIISTFIPQIL